MPDIDATRLWADVESLARFTDPVVPYTRLAFTPLYVEGRAWLARRMEEAGLAVEIDAGGNLIGRLAGSESDLRPIVVGSHSDTVRGGGRFDGVVGVLAGLEVVRALQDDRERLRHPLELIDFLAEEPSAFGISCVGSRALVGALSPAMLAACNLQGQSLAEGIRFCGGDPNRLGAPVHGSIAGCFELHIEQGPVLETREIPIGVVTEIVGIRRINLVVTGQADHAGTTPMALRRDALVGAARIIDHVHAQARQAKDSSYLVATVGSIAVEPNASNVVPSKTNLVLEVRSNSDAEIDRFCDVVLDWSHAAMDGLGLGFAWQDVSRSPSTVCAPAVRRAIEGACRECSLGFLLMPSGAGHDTVYMAKLGPAGMIFIPCRGGRSHCVEEWTEVDQVTAGASVLRRAITLYDRAV